MRIRSLKSAALALAALIAAGCAAPAPEVQLVGPTMGTVYRVRVAAAAPDRDALKALVEDRLAAVDQAMSTYRSDSEVSSFNRLRAGDAHRFSEPAWELLELAWKVREKSRGAFDPTVGPLVNAWGFGAPGRGEDPTPPAADRLAALRRALGAVELSPEGRRARKLDAGVALDFSAIAKGWAVDRISEALLEQGYADHLVEVGGEVRTAGHGPGGEPWRIGIERPPALLPGVGPGTSASAAAEAAPAGLQRVLEVTNGALATSGDYRNFWERDGVRYSHTIDPRTGRPVEHALASASVFHPSCALADAYATALMVLGPEDGLRWADENGIAALLLVYRGNALEESRSAAFRRRFGRREASG